MKKRAKLKLMVCVAENNLIGDKNPEGNGLLWHSKEELKYYKETTTGHVTLFGKNTALCVPVELMRKTREVILLTRDTDIDALLEKYGETGKTVFVCGGEQIYRYFLENYPMDELLVSRLKPHVEVQKPKAPLYLPHVEKYGYEVIEICDHEDFQVYKYRKK
ncbi:MAG: dihydrofolate reductase [Fusobacteriaceae bacterium]